MSILLIIILIITNIRIDTIDFNKQNKFIIEIKGEVLNEGIIETTNNMIVDDVLKIAGLKDDADLSAINRSLKVYPEMVIIIPKLDKDKTLISINSANIKELTSLPGIKEATANKIIEYRLKNGSFIYLEQLMNVPGIGVKKYDKIKEYICL